MPQIVLDATAQEDREDDPNFDEGKKEEEPEEILAELKNEPVEILPDLTSKEDSLDPLHLSAFKISQVNLPSEQSQFEDCQNFFKKMLLEKYGSNLEKGLAIIENFEKD